MVPFLAFDREIRSLISTTNAVESLNARLRRAVNASGHFPHRDDSAGEFAYEPAACGARAARWEVRVRPRGTPANQASSRVRLTAVAVRTC